MIVLYFLLPLALILGAVFLYFFILAVNGNQYEDLETPAYKALIDETER